MVERREFLRKAPIGTGAFAVPMILTVDPADAQAVASPPPESPAQTSPPTNGITGSTAPGPSAANRPASGRSELPRTGADIDRLVAAGLAATAAGASLLLWSADAGSHAATSATVLDAPPPKSSRAGPET
jgi:hypothetical protein